MVTIIIYETHNAIQLTIKKTTRTNITTRTNHILHSAGLVSATLKSNQQETKHPRPKNSINVIQKTNATEPDSC